MVQPAEPPPSRSPLPLARRALLGVACALTVACNTQRHAADPSAANGAPLTVSLRTFEDRVDVYAEGALFATVRLGDEEGPCVFPLLGASGERVTRGFPIEPGPDDAQDHPHHRSLWFAHGDVNGVDFWHAGGHIEVQGYEVTLRSKSVAVVELALAWRANDGTEVLREKRRLSFHAERGLRWVEARHQLEPAVDGVVFGDTKEGTFALRVAPTLRAEGPVAAGTLFDANGRTGGDVWGKRSAWIAATGPVPDATGASRPVTIAMLDHPRNPRFPTWWHARTYGLLAANPFGKGAFEGRTLDEDGTYPLSRSEQLVLRYRVLIGDGPLTPERIEAEATRFGGDSGDGSLI